MEFGKGVERVERESQPQLFVAGHFLVRSIQGQGARQPEPGAVACGVSKRESPCTTLRHSRWFCGDLAETGGGAMVAFRDGGRLCGLSDSRFAAPIRSSSCRC